MYPNLYYAFKDIFGVDWKFLRVANTFGVFVAISFILAAVVLTAELRRKSKEGLLSPTEISVVVGKPASFVELLLNFLMGFIFGYKFIGLFLMGGPAASDPPAFIFSSLGSWPAGIITGLIFAGFKWWEKNKQKLPKPEERKIRFWPHDRVGEITILALVFGLIGAKVFDFFENWDDFIKKPSEYIFSPAGLTFYGGLICAALAIWIYARKHKIGFWHLNDAAAPALMLSYATGRIGCQVAGDGDWGIYNSAFQVSPDGVISPSTAENFTTTLQKDSFFPSFIYYSVRKGEEMGSLDEYLQNLSRYYFEKVSRRTRVILSFIQPALLVFCALILLFVVSAFIMPVYSNLSNIAGGNVKF